MGSSIVGGGGSDTEMEETKWGLVVEEDSLDQVLVPGQSEGPDPCPWAIRFLHWPGPLFQTLYGST